MERLNRRFCWCFEIDSFLRMQFVTFVKSCFSGIAYFILQSQVTPPSFFVDPRRSMEGFHQVEGSCILKFCTS